MKHFICLLFFILAGLSYRLISQTNQSSYSFWKRLKFGGGLAANFGNNFTNVGVSPTVIYPFNDVFALGVSGQFNYTEQRNFFQNTVYGAGLIGLINPIQNIQLSAELDQLRVNQKLFNPDENLNFWNTALFLGAGYQSNNVIFGLRYNVLFREGDNLYSEAWMPFVRVFF